MSENASANKQYGHLIKTVEETIKKMQACDDVDEILSMYEYASQSLKECAKKLEDAKGKFEKISVVANSLDI